MRYIFVLTLIISNTICFSQGFIPVDTLNFIPEELRTAIDEDIEIVFRIDFTGDDKEDYLVEVQDEEEYMYKEYWITSELEVLMTKKRYALGIQYMKFLNFDDDPELEIYSASGYEDGIDYALYDLDLNTGTEKLLFYFNPVIVEDDNHYWGYPWDILNMLVKNVDGKMKILSSTDHNIIRDGNITIPGEQSIFPCIFFNGTSTQPDIRVDEIRNIKWSTIEELVKTVHNNR